MQGALTSKFTQRNSAEQFSTVGPGTLNHAQQSGWQRHRETLQEQPFKRLYFRGRATQVIPTNLLENTRNLQASDVFGDLITQHRNEGHYLRRSKYFLPHKWQRLIWSLCLKISPSDGGATSGRCDGYEVLRVPGGRSNPCWRPRCFCMYEWATHRLSRYDPVGEGTVRRVVCRNEIGYKDVSEKHITRCHHRKRRYVFGTCDSLGRTELQTVYVTWTALSCICIRVLTNRFPNTCGSSRG